MAAISCTIFIATLAQDTKREVKDYATIFQATATIFTGPTPGTFVITFSWRHVTSMSLRVVFV
jgi:hypothetical protein